MENRAVGNGSAGYAEPLKPKPKARAMSGQALVDSKTTLVMVGPTGQGKSTLGNLLVGGAHFGTSDDFNSETLDAAHADFVVQGSQYRAIDTIGFLDTRMGAEENLDKFADFADRAPDGISAFVFVLKKGRFTESSLEQFIAFEGVAGANALRHTILVFTHCGAEPNVELLRRCQSSTNKYLQQAVEKVHSVVGVDSLDTDRCSDDRKAVLDSVAAVLLSNNGEKYDNTTLTEARRRRLELQEIIQSLSKERKEAMQTKLDGLFHGRFTYDEVHAQVLAAKERDVQEEDERRRWQEEWSHLQEQLAAAAQEAAAWKEVAKDVLSKSLSQGQRSAAQLGNCMCAPPPGGASHVDTGEVSDFPVRPEAQMQEELQRGMGGAAGQAVSNASKAAGRAANAAMGQGFPRPGGFPMPSPARRL